MPEGAKFKLKLIVSSLSFSHFLYKSPWQYLLNDEPKPVLWKVLPSQNCIVSQWS